MALAGVSNQGTCFNCLGNKQHKTITAGESRSFAFIKKRFIGLIALLFRKASQSHLVGESGNHPV
ncbi:MAG: hypothetical protein AAF891_00905 [Pseudomonadota bacterium]